MATVVPFDDVSAQFDRLVAERSPSAPVFDLMNQVLGLYKDSRQSEWDRKSLAFALNSILSLYDNRRGVREEKFKMSF